MGVAMAKTNLVDTFRFRLRNASDIVTLRRRETAAISLEGHSETGRKRRGVLQALPVHQDDAPVSSERSGRKRWITPAGRGRPFWIGDSGGRCARGLGRARLGFCCLRLYAALRESFPLDRKSTRNSSHPSISYAVFCLKKK